MVSKRSAVQKGLDCFLTAGQTSTDDMVQVLPLTEENRVTETDVISQKETSLINKSMRSIDAVPVENEEEETVVPMKWMSKNIESVMLVADSLQTAVLVEKSYQTEPAIIKLTGRILESKFGKKGTYRPEQNWKLSNTFRTMSKKF